MNKTTLILIIIVILVVAVGGYLIYANQSPVYKTTPQSGTNTTPNTNTACVSDWQCGWSPCVNGSQSQVATDYNNCGTGQSTIACPALARVCGTQPENLSASVSIKNFAFSPATLNIKAGTTVTWTNNDPMAHQIKSDTFNSAVLNNGQSFSFTFSAAGQYNYSCAIHPSMKGKIIVTK